jgi:hypothetical protein
MPLRRWQLSAFAKERLFVNVERRHLLGHKNLGMPPCVIGISSPIFIFFIAIGFHIVACLMQI